MKKLISIIYFNIGVDVIGLPKSWGHIIVREKSNKTCFNKLQRPKTNVIQFYT